MSFSFSLSQIVLVTIAYLSAMFLVALAADRGLLPRRITHHPATYVLSLGVIAGAIATNGVFALAAEYGYSYLFYYIGVVIMFMLATLLLLPILRLCRVYQLASMADVLAFRFRSQWVGAAVTLAMCATLLPLLALQIQAVADAIHILAGDDARLLPATDHQDGLALLFCIIITAFSIFFGTRNVSTPNRNTGMVTAMAFESLVKMTAMLALMFMVVDQVFGGFANMEVWLSTQPQVTAMLERPVKGESARTMLLLFFAGAVCMPHIFHMAFAENTDSQDLRVASWALPLYLLLLSLPVLPLIWAGMKLGHDLPVEYSGIAIGLALESTAISAAAFGAGLSAASAAIIVTTLALANMCLNHLVLPRTVMQLHRDQSFYLQLKWQRRGLITLLIGAGYLFFIALNGRQSLAELGFVAFSGTLHFLPGIVATPYWPGANRKGLLAGLAAGISVWILTLLLPVLGGPRPEWLYSWANQWFGGFTNTWAAESLVALLLNVVVFVVVSVLTRASKEEQVAAEICSMDDNKRAPRQTLAITNAAEFATHLSEGLGQEIATTEVNQALAELQFDAGESRPYALRRLRVRLETNLSRLLGPGVALNMINRCLPYQPELHDTPEDFTQLERKVDKAQGQFTGVAADLNNLRRHYRETLDNLPMGVCSSADDGEVLLWNRSMEQITGIPASAVVGAVLSSMNSPWREIISDFTGADSEAVAKREVVQESGNSRWISLHKASNTGTRDDADRVILVEDVTDYEVLQSELLHSERLASIGRLAAGVAHEIGNPVTGIACLAQNLAYENDPEEIRDTAESILKQTDRVTRIVESLVNFSHVGSGAGDLRLGPCNLADCVDEAIHLLQLDRQAKHINYQNECDREQLVLADSQRLLQVFINLLSNARDACDDGGIVNISEDLQDEKVAISVEDNGSGIPAEVMDRIFEPFFTTKDPGEGTGLGLALVYSIMEDMGGALQVHSPATEDHEAGTRVSLELPHSNYGSAFEV
ncbi:MAG: ATP-binding protein [Halioglobus sp.]